MTSLAYKLEHDDGQVEVIHVNPDPSLTTASFLLCITLSFDAGTLACCRNADRQICTVLPSFPGARVERPLLLDGIAANGGTT